MNNKEFRDLLNAKIGDTALQNIDKDMYIDLASIAGTLDHEMKFMNSEMKELISEQWADFLYIVNIAYALHRKETVCEVKA